MMQILQQNSQILLSVIKFIDWHVIFIPLPTGTRLKDLTPPWRLFKKDFLVHAEANSTVAGEEDDVAIGPPQGNVVLERQTR